MNYYDANILVIDFEVDDDMISEAIKEAYEYADPDYTYLDTLEFKCSMFSANKRIVNDTQEITYNGQTYIPVFFSFSIPDIAPNVKGEFSITLQAIDRETRDDIRNISKTNNVLYVKYMQIIQRIGYSTDDVSSNCWFQVISIKEKINSIMLTASPPDLTQYKFPDRIMTVDNLPGARV